MFIPKLDKKILDESKKMADAKKESKRKTELYEWAKDKGIDLLALIVSIIALLRTF